MQRYKFYPAKPTVFTVFLDWGGLGGGLKGIYYLTQPDFVSKSGVFIWWRRGRVELPTLVYVVISTRFAEIRE